LSSLTRSIHGISREISRGRFTCEMAYSDSEPESSNPLIYRLQQASRCLHPSNQKPPLMPHKQVCSQIIIRHESLL
jgi:hypothetical protein